MEQGTILRAKKSRKTGDVIAYDKCGKVILIGNQDDVKPGFIRIETVTEKDKCYVATAKNVPHDFYPDIPMDELREVLTQLGFVEEYSEPIDEDNEFVVFANLNTGEMVTVETWNMEGEHTYNSVMVYIPISSRMWDCHDGRGFSMRSGHLAAYNVVFSHAEFPIRAVLSLSSKTRNWNGEHPNLWHYGEKEVDFVESLKKIYKFKDDVNAAFNIQAEKAIAAMQSW